MYDSLTAYLTLTLLMGNPVFAHNDCPFVTLAKDKKQSHHDTYRNASSQIDPKKNQTRVKGDKIIATSYLTSKNIAKPTNTVEKVTDTFSHIISVSNDTNIVEDVISPLESKIKILVKNW